MSRNFFLDFLYYIFVGKHYHYARKSDQHLKLIEVEQKYNSVLHKIMQLWRGSDALSYSPILLLLVIQLLFYHSVKGLHLTGTFNNHDFFQFLAKFGFQKVDKNDKPGTTGYIYGRITAKNFNITSVNHDMYLVVVDSQYFVQYYAQSEKDIPRRCTNMFSKIDQIAWDSYCVRNGVEDFLRRIPCPADSYCLEELGNLSAVLADQQFTYRIIDLNQPRQVIVTFLSLLHY